MEAGVDHRKMVPRGLDWEDGGRLRRMVEMESREKCDVN